MSARVLVGKDKGEAVSVRAGVKVGKGEVESRGEGGQG